MNKCPTCGRLTKQEVAERIRVGLKKSSKTAGRRRTFVSIEKILLLQRMGYSYRAMEKRIGIDHNIIQRRVKEYYDKKV